MAVSLSRGVLFHLLESGDQGSEVGSRARRWRGDMTDLRLHTADKTLLLTHSSEEALSQSWRRQEEGRSAGWKWRTRQKKQTVPSKDLPFYTRLKWMSGPRTPLSSLPMSSWHHCAADKYFLHPACAGHVIGHTARIWKKKRLWSAWHEQNSVSFIMCRTAAQLCLRRKTIYISTLCFDFSLYFFSPVLTRLVNSVLHRLSLTNAVAHIEWSIRSFIAFNTILFLHGGLCP